MSKSKSNLTYLHKVMTQNLTNDVVVTHEEQIIDGPKGISIKYFSKDKSGNEKITIYQKDGEYILKMDINGEKSEKKMTKAELLDELKKNKKLKFAADFAKTQKGGALLERPKKRASKSKSKKASSKKVVKKGKSKSKSRK